jgi:hypothetical protein
MIDLEVGQTPVLMVPYITLIMLIGHLMKLSLTKLENITLKKAGCFFKKNVLREAFFLPPKIASTSASSGLCGPSGQTKNKTIENIPSFPEGIVSRRE